jgi:hypothetical protein
LALDICHLVANLLDNLLLSIFSTTPSAHEFFGLTRLPNAVARQQTHNVVLDKHGFNGCLQLVLLPDLSFARTNVWRECHNRFFGFFVTAQGGPKGDCSSSGKSGVK